MTSKLTKSSLVLLLMLFSCITLIAQQKIVTGRIADSDGKALEAVTVGIKGTNKNVTTNADGQFSISVPGPNAVLSVSSAGFSSTEVTVGTKLNITVTLEKETKQLEDVVIVGYGTQKRTHLTGSVGTVDMKSIQDIHVGSMSEALKGQIVGVGVSGGFSRPGEPATITIRNPIFYSKDGGSKEPLFVIDDIIRTKADFDLLDATEVENISVLKDAAAAIYGILGSNGAVIVKTKRGRSGLSTVTYSGSVGISDAAYRPKMMSAYDHARYMNNYLIESVRYSANPQSYLTNANYFTTDELEYFKTNDHDWLDMAWQKATETRHAISISGGSDKSTYFAGFTYNSQNSNFDGSRFNRYSFRASSDIKLATGLKLGLSLSGSLSDKKNTFSKQGTEDLNNDWRYLLTQSRFNPPYINGLPILVPGAGTNSNVNNYHFFAVQNTDNYTQSKGSGINFQGQVSYDIPFIKGLKAAVNYNKNITNSWGKQYGTKYNVYSFVMSGGNKHLFTETPAATNPITTLNNGDRVRLNPTIVDAYQLNGSLNYDRTFGKHQVNILAAYEQSETFADGIAGQREGVVIGGLDNQNFATGEQSSSETISEAGRMAYVGRLNYNYDGKYLAEIVYRGDASQNFAPENRWGTFPSFSAGWVISEEKFFGKALKTINYLKLRGSAGFLGLDATKSYQWLRSYAIQTGRAAIFGGNNDRGLAVVTDVELANRKVQWDNVDKYNIGLDAKFLRNRLSATLDAYIDYRSDMLTALTSSPSILIGTAIPSENFSKVNTFGYEASLNWNGNISKNWNYNITANFSWSDNKILLTDVAKGNIGTYLDPTGLSSDMGYLGYHALGMFRSQADVDAWLVKYPNYKMFNNVIRPGMLYFQDVRGPKDASGKYTAPDGTITSDDQDFLNKKNDNHYGLGLNWGVSYKTLSLRVVMGMSWGGVSSVESAARKRAEMYANRPEFWADHWTPENPNAAYPNPFYTFSYDTNTDFWWKNSFSFGVSNFNLSYALPQRWSNKAGMKNAKIYLIGTNPLDFVNPYSYKGPSGSYDVFPTLKSYSLGVNLSL